MHKEQTRADSPVIQQPIVLLSPHTPAETELSSLYNARLVQNTPGATVCSSPRQAQEPVLQVRARQPLSLSGHADMTPCYTTDDGVVGTIVSAYRYPTGGPRCQANRLHSSSMMWLSRLSSGGRQHTTKPPGLPARAPFPQGSRLHPLWYGLSGFVCFCQNLSPKDSRVSGAQGRGRYPGEHRDHHICLWQTPVSS